MRAHVKDVARYSVAGHLSHEGLTPETELCFGLTFPLVAREHERHAFLHRAPAWFADLLTPATPGQLWQHIGFPMFPLARVEDELDVRHQRAFDGRPEQAIEEILRPEHRQADVEPQHLAARLTREL